MSPRLCFNLLVLAGRRPGGGKKPDRDGEDGEDKPDRPRPSGKPDGPRPSGKPDRPRPSGKPDGPRPSGKPPGKPVDDEESLMRRLFRLLEASKN